METLAANEWPKVSGRSSREGNTVPCAKCEPHVNFDGLRQQASPVNAVRPSNSLGREDSWEKGIYLHSSYFVSKIYGQRSLAGHSPWGHRVGHNWFNLLSLYYWEGPAFCRLLLDFRFCQIYFQYRCRRVVIAFSLFDR